MGWTFQRHKEQLGHELQLKANGNKVSNLQFCSQEFSWGFSNAIAINFKVTQISGCQGSECTPPPPWGSAARVRVNGGLFQPVVAMEGSQEWWGEATFSQRRHFDPARATTMKLCRSVPEGYTTITFKRSKDRPCGGSLSQSTWPLRISS